MAKAATLALLVLLVFLAACASVPSPPPLPSPTGTPLPNFSFAHDFGACSTTALFKIEFEVSPGTLLFTGEAGVPNPCHKLTAWPEISGNEIVLKIDKNRTADVCVQCWASIPFAGRVGSLEPGFYTVRVVMDGAEQRYVRLQIPGKSEASLVCGGIAGIGCPSGYRCALEGDFPDAAGRCVPGNATAGPFTPLPR